MAFSPYDAATDSIKRAQALLRRSRVRVKGQRQSTGPDLRRLSIVMAVAALDTYMHRLVVERAYWHDEPPGALAKLEFRYDQVLEQTDAIADAARAAPSNTRPRVGLKRQLRERLLRETFQSFENVSTALAMAGQKKKWDTIGAAMNPPQSKEDVKVRLNSIVRRRNQIVHEGDYKRLERPQGPTRNPISYSRARSDVGFIEDLIDAIHAAVSS